MHKRDISRFTNSDEIFKSKRKVGPIRKLWNIIKSLFMISWRLFISFMFISAFSGSLILISLATYKSSLLENDIALNINASKMALTSFIYVNDAQGNPVEYQKIYSTENRVWVDFRDIPEDMKSAVVAIEDKRFYEHKGVDWVRTFGAGLNCLSGNQSYGGSTLTQQLIKNITGDDQASLSRKAREIFRALQVEENFSKDEILESYLNVVNFGNGCRGVQAAANSYFGKNIQECSAAECAAIASITQNPSAYNPLLHPEKNKQRRELVLSEMLEQGRISINEYSDALKESENMDFSKAEKKSKTDRSTSDIKNWYVETLLRDVVNDLCEKYHVGKSTAEDMLYTQGLKIYCAMDTTAQSIAENTLKDSSVMPKDKNIQLGYTMMDLNGRILATIGSRNEKKGNLLYDRANVAKRQPGSTIKPLSAYAPVIDWNIYNYSSLIPDEPLRIDSDGNNVVKNWPENWYKSYKGKVTLQWAIEKSANAPVAQIIKLLTPQKSYEFLTQKLGFKSLDANDAVSLSALATGGTHYGVTPREMTGAFQIFGNGGKYHKPYTYFYVTDRNDKVILDNRENEPIEAISSESATIMNRLLRNVIIGPEGTGRNANISGWDIVGKTGTTTDDHDSWFIGLSPYAVAGIWTGYDNPKRIHETTAAIRIWKAIMSKYLEKKKNKDFDFDENVVTARYSKSSGKIVSYSNEGTALGYYKKENIPSNYYSNNNVQSTDTDNSSSDNSSEQSQNEESTESSENSENTDNDLSDSLIESITQESDVNENTDSNIE